MQGEGGVTVPLLRGRLQIGRKRAKPDMKGVAA